jgi:hypothetical protein
MPTLRLSDIPTSGWKAIAYLLVVLLNVVTATMLLVGSAICVLSALRSGYWIGPALALAGAIGTIVVVYVGAWLED